MIEAGLRKVSNNTPQQRAAIWAAIAKMRRPLVATHVRPDGDAWGSGIAVVKYLKNGQGKPFLYLNPHDRLPLFFRTLIERGKVPVVGAADDIEVFDGLILLDTAAAHRIEPPVSALMTSLLARGLPVVDIDHHVGEPLIAPLVNTLVDETASSTAELAAQLLPENRKIGRIVARALLAGIISDTSNLRFKVTPVTYETVAALTRRCGGRVDLRSMFFDTQGVDTAARALIRDLMKRSQERCVQIAGTEYHLKFVVVGRDGMPAGDDRWRVPLSNELGFGGNGTSGCDLVLLIYPTPDKYRGSLRAYNKGMQLDLRQVAGAISSGGGQPGAVGFDFAYESFADDAAAVDSVLTAIQSHAVPFSPAT